MPLLFSLIFFFTGLLLTGCQSNSDVSPSADNIKAKNNPQTIQRGQYLVYGPAGCARCHTDREKQSKLQNGAMLPLTGGRHWDSALGDIYAANLTPDIETGIGSWSDAEIARAIRHGVNNRGELLAPFMEYDDIKDEDLIAIISYLRTIKAVKNKVPEKNWSFIGLTAKTFVLKPREPSGKVYAERGTTAEYGEYLANVISHCVSCHTERDLGSGKFIGEPLAGGTRFPAEKDPSKIVIPPNITTDKKTGRLGNWTEEQFILRMRSGPSVKETHMPWGAFKLTDDNDLKAIYRYLKSVKPVEKDNGPTVQENS